MKKKKNMHVMHCKTTKRISPFNSFGQETSVMCCGIFYIAFILSIFCEAGIDGSGNTDDEFMEAVLGLTGCETAEELNEYEIDRYYELYSMPLQLNYASRSRLLASGLFSAYQVAVLTDYREMAGDILSIEELSALDGFGHDFVSCLKYFISLSSSALPGRSSVPGKHVRNSLTLKSGIRNISDRPEPEGSYSMKYRLSVSDMFEAGISLRSAYGKPHLPPETYSFFAAVYGRKFPGKVVIGDYNLRFGQGLAMWSGFSMGGLASPDAFVRSPSGISPYNSYSGEGAFRGVAADYSKRHFSVSLFAAGLGLRELMEGEEEISRDILYGTSLGWYGMAGQASLTGYAVSAIPCGGDGTGTSVPEEAGSDAFRAAKCSADAKFSFGGTVLFAEAAIDLKDPGFAALAGCRTHISDAHDVAFMARYYPESYLPDYSGAATSGTKCSNEYGVSAAWSHSAGQWIPVSGRTGFGSSEKRFSGTFSVDAACSPGPKYGVDTSSVQVKVQLKESIRLLPYLGVTVRLSERYRSYRQPFRTDVRTDFELEFPGWLFNLRLNLLHCENLSGLSYFETGYKSGNLSLWLRNGVFVVDDWDDRIYAYERDAPGNFNSPAFYGRGYWVALTSGWNAARGFRLYFRGMFQNYFRPVPPETEQRPPKIELKFQLVMDLHDSRKNRAP